MKPAGLGCVHLLLSQKIYLHWHLLIEEGDTVVAMEVVDKEIVAVVENGDQQKMIEELEIEIETETETEMKIEIELVIYGIGNEQNRMLIDLAMLQSYLMRRMTN